jgi:hypothetical protein
MATEQPHSPQKKRLARGMLHPLRRWCSLSDDQEEKCVSASGTHPHELNAAPVAFRQPAQWQWQTPRIGELTCSTTAPQEHDWVRGAEEVADASRSSGVTILRR